VIELAEVRKTFNDGRPEAWTAVDGVSLSIPAGSLTVLRGPSGAGKTTLLALLGCMARPTAGRVHVFGRETTSLPERFLTEVRRATFGFVFQRFELIDRLSALENVLVPTLPTGEPRRAAERRALALLERLGVGGRARTAAGWLSGGEAQRVAIARALVNEPRVLVADEPTAHLDTARSAELLGILRGLRAEGKTVVVASHDPLVHEAAGVDRVVTLRDGKIVGAGA